MTDKTCDERIWDKDGFDAYICGRKAKYVIKGTPCYGYPLPITKYRCGYHVDKTDRQLMSEEDNV